MEISIIIPTFNRGKVLKSTVLSIISHQYANCQYEIIVVDNGSTDETKIVCSEFANQIVNFSYYYDATPGLLTGRHIGASKAKGEIFAFIDDDVVVSDTWLNTIHSVMSKRNDIGFLTGPNLPLYHSYPPDWLSFFWSESKNGKECGWLSLIDFGKEEKEISPNYIWGLNFIIRKSIFQILGGFHPDNISKEFQHFQGDGETGLTLKAVEQNIKALYHPGVLLYHQVPSTRMTYEYFDNRAYYQGVCDSFTRLRKENGLYKTSLNIRKSPSFISKAKHFATKKIDNFLKPDSNNSILPEEIRSLMKRFEAKRTEGFDFHQTAFRENKQVRDWVLRENYFEYKLPKND